MKNLEYLIFFDTSVIQQWCTPLSNSETIDQILQLLKKHPEGLTAVDIARMLGSHRHTVTKYIYQLLGAGRIFQRQVGSAKLCYLKAEGKGKERWRFL